MADLRIVDAPEIPTANITGEEKLPTGGSGNYSISLDSVADYTKTKKDLADNTSVDSKVNGVRQELDAHIEDLTNPHRVTKGQIGLGDVDNTADLDKPVSNSTQAAIISAVTPKADKTYVDNQLTLKANKADVYTKQESYDLVNNSISTALTPINTSLDLAKRGIANRYDPLLTYNSGERVVLTNGDIVKSTIEGNANDPNVDMTGWAKTNSASQIFDESGKTQQSINTAIFKNTYYAELEGFIGDGVTDNFAVWEALKSKLNNGDAVIFKSGEFFFSQEISIDKVVSIQGMLRSQAIGTVFKFNGTSGVTRNSQYSSLENISIFGTKTNTILDFDNRIFGTVGLKEAYSSPTARSSGGILRNVSVIGFDVNRLAAQENSEVWAGAYRENYNVLLRSGRWAYVALDGATHEKFYGGVISANTEGGVYSKATKTIAGGETYNNIEIHGTTMEQNGNQNADFVGDATDYNVNIYSHGNSRIKLYGAYNEKANNYAVDGGEIIYFGTHQHSNVKNFASNGQIIDYSGYGAYANTLRFDYKLARLFTANTGATTASISIASNTMQVTSSTNGTVQIATPSINVRSIKNKELRAVKIAYQYKFNSGFTANTDLVVQPLIRLLSATAGRTDGNIINRAFPTQILKKSYGQTHSLEFYYIPRFGDTLYLDSEGVLSAVQLILQLKNGEADPNFSSDNLSLGIDSVEITLISDVKFDLRYDLLKDGVTASRPTLSIFERGFLYYDTTLGRNVTWDGSAWVEKQPPIETSNTAAMSSLTNAINTTGKYTRFVYNTTNGKIYYPTNTTATAAWRATDGSGDITPA